MKVAQKTVVRWMSKLVLQAGSRTARQHRSTELRVLDSEQLRHVSGGNGGSAQGPNRGW